VLEDRVEIKSHVNISDGWADKRAVVSSHDVIGDASAHPVKA
jgi:hypothetical protein